MEESKILSIDEQIKQVLAKEEQAKRKLEENTAKARKAILDKAIEPLKQNLIKALGNFEPEEGYVITMWKDKDGIHVTYGKRVSTDRTSKNGKSAAKKLAIPEDVQKAWKTEPEYESQQAFMRFVVGDDNTKDWFSDTPAADAKDVSHARRDTFKKLCSDGAEENGMSLKKAWAMILAFNLKTDS